MRTVQDFQRRFPTSDHCLQYVFERRFPQLECSKCHRVDAYHKHPTKPCYTCNCGQSHIFPQKDTIFQDTRLPLQKWFYAVFLMSRSEDGVSAKELERQLKVMYPTAWRMAKKIRGVMRSEQWKEHPLSFEALLLCCIGLTPDSLGRGQKKTPVAVMRKSTGQADATRGRR